MLLKVLIVLAVVVGVFLVFVALRPSAFRVTRSASIAAPPEAIFAQVNDLHKWEAWSPWAKLDPAAKNSYAGPVEGAGATFAWSGNNKIGEGRMTITESRPYELIRFKLDFVKPFKGTNTAEFTFKPEGNQTVVTWTMLGQNNFISKAIQIFVNCEKMVGGQFEKGFAEMKAITEAEIRK
jgi:uncharacterized protein YndB with AHSA1/START domain